MPSSYEIQQLDAVITMLSENPALAHTSAEVAKLSGISPFRLKQLFRQHTGLTIQQFLTSAKMNKAALLLAQDITIKEISLSLGYSDLTSFYRSFVKYYHCTPLQYRQKL